MQNLYSSFFYLNIYIQSQIFVINLIAPLIKLMIFLAGTEVIKLIS